MLAWLLSDTAYYLGGVLFAIVGLYLLITGWRGKRPAKPTCRKCRYDMSAATSLSCSECGTKHRDAGYLWKSRARKLRLLMGLLLVGFVYYAHSWPEVKWRQWTLKEPWFKSVVPTSVWIVLMPKLEEENWKLIATRIEHATHMAQAEFDPSMALSSTGGQLIVRAQSATSLFSDDDDDQGKPDDIALPRWQLWLLMRSCDAMLRDKMTNSDVRTLLVKWSVLASPRVASAVEPLSAALSEPNWDALRAIGAMGSRGSSAIPSLVTEVNNYPNPFAAECALTLLKLRAHLKGHESSLIQSFESARPAVLSLLQNHLSAFVAHKFDSVTRDYIISDRTLDRLTILRALLRHENSPIWADAGLKCVQGNWSNAADLMPLLMNQLTDTSKLQPGEYVLSHAIKSIGRIRKEDESTIRTIIANTNAHGRGVLLLTIRMLDKSTLNTLMILARDPNVEIADGALHALQAIPDKSHATIVEMASSVLGHAEQTRWTVVDVLRELKSLPPEALDLLASHVSDPRQRARELAVAGLMRWAPQRCRTILESRLSAVLLHARLEACDFLRSLGAGAESSLPLLRQAAEKDVHPLVQQAALDAIVAIESAIETDKAGDCLNSPPS
ncbi:MAG: HEAT repeat domain-containing protein [Phycisphaeraceae bacterium]